MPRPSRPRGPRRRPLGRPVGTSPSRAAGHGRTPSVVVRDVVAWLFEEEDDASILAEVRGGAPPASEWDGDADAGYDSAPLMDFLRIRRARLTPSPA